MANIGEPVRKITVIPTKHPVPEKYQPKVAPAPQRETKPAPAPAPQREKEPA